MRRTIKILGAISLATLAGGLLLWLGFRDLLLERTLAKAESRAMQNGMELKFSNPHWVGLRTIHCDQITLEQNDNPIFLAKEVKIVPGLAQIWNSSAGFASVSIDSFHYAYHKREETTSAKSPAKDHPLFKLIESGFKWLGRSGSLTISHGIIESENGSEISISLNEGKFAAEISTLQNDVRNHFRAEGTCLPSGLQLSLYSEGKSNLSFHDADLFLDEATCDLKIAPLPRGGFGISISGGADTSSIFHRALNGQPLGFGATEINLSAIADPTGFYILPSSFLSHHNIKTTFEFYAPADKTKMISMGVTLPPVSGIMLSESLPSNAFQVLRATPPRGTVKGNFAISFVPGNAESLSFTGDFVSDSLSLPGGHPIQQLNTCFRYIPEQSKGDTAQLRRMQMCDSNPNWIQLKDCPPLLIQSVLIAEDPDYYSHHGINASMIRQSAVENFNNGKFKRGASTIPMQVMRNVFLHREKTLCRKLEEIALVWINEETQTVSKDRMLELYLNLAQWGPDEFGVQEAAQFYFGKNAASLTADECIFLAGLLPNPAKFKTQFTESKTLKPYILDFFTGVKLKLFDQDLLESDALDAPVNLRLKSGRI